MNKEARWRAKRHPNPRERVTGIDSDPPPMAAATPFPHHAQRAGQSRKHTRATNIAKQVSSAHTYSETCQERTIHETTASSVNPPATRGGENLGVTRTVTVQSWSSSLSVEATVVSDVTRILSQIESGDPSAAEQLLPLVYEELRKLAAAKLAQRSPGRHCRRRRWCMRRICGWWMARRRSTGIRGHFFAAAAEAMRRILVEQARVSTASGDEDEADRSHWTSCHLMCRSPNPDDCLRLDEALAEAGVDGCRLRQVW